MLREDRQLTIQSRPIRERAYREVSLKDMKTRENKAYLRECRVGTIVRSCLWPGRYLDLEIYGSVEDAVYECAGIFLGNIFWPGRTAVKATFGGVSEERR